MTHVNLNPSSATDNGSKRVKPAGEEDEEEREMKRCREERDLFSTAESSSSDG